MSERQRFYVEVGLNTAAGVFDAKRKRVYDRADYTLPNAHVVVDWLNGHDQPLPTMIVREHDEWDPGRPEHLRGKPEPYLWIVGRTRTSD